MPLGSSKNHKLLVPVVPVDAAVVLAGAGGAIVATVAASNADVAFCAGAEHLCLLNLHYPHFGFLISLLLHCLLSFIGRYAQNYKKIISKIIRRLRIVILRIVFDNFLIQFFYNFERSDLFFSHIIAM